MACWGANRRGALGDGTEENRLVPRPVRDLDDAVAIATGSSFSCALRKTGRVACWGWGSGGAHGLDTMHAILTPRDVDGVVDAIALSAGMEGVCATTRGRELVCWGSNSHGQIGAPPTTFVAAPTAIAFGEAP